MLEINPLLFSYSHSHNVQAQGLAQVFCIAALTPSEGSSPLHMLGQYTEASLADSYTTSGTSFEFHMVSAKCMKEKMAAPYVQFAWI